jgi:hypothetical protein
MGGWIHRGQVMRKTTRREKAESGYNRGAEPLGTGISGTVLCS